MTDDLIEAALRITLADARLSRGEKRALAKVVEPFSHDERRLQQARQSAFNIAREAVQEPQACQVISWLEDVLRVLVPSDDSGPENGQTKSEAFFSPAHNCVDKIVRQFQTARRSVDVCVFTITDDRITDAILEAHRRKVAIRIISDDEKQQDLGSDIMQLIRQGVDVRLDQSEYHMHHKYAVFDNRRLLTGSYNWTRGAAQHNEENFILTSDASLLRAFRSSFEQLWEQLGPK